MKRYVMSVHGVETILKLTAEEAVRLGAVEYVKHPEPVVESKVREAVPNKARASVKRK